MIRLDPSHGKSTRDSLVRIFIAQHTEGSKIRKDELSRAMRNRNSWKKAFINL